jgi:hypothetical protein
MGMTERCEPKPVTSPEEQLAYTKNLLDQYRTDNIELRQKCNLLDMQVKVYKQLDEANDKLIKKLRETAGLPPLDEEKEDA